MTCAKRPRLLFVQMYLLAILQASYHELPCAAAGTLVPSARVLHGLTHRTSPDQRTALASGVSMSTPWRSCTPRQSSHLPRPQPTSFSELRGTASAVTSLHEVIKLGDPAAISTGHGGTATMTCAKRPRLLFVQVKNALSLFAPRTRHLGLVVLPCPGRCLVIVHDCVRVILQLLLLAGDVEENPGPANTRSADTQHNGEILSALQQIQSSQATMLNEIKSIHATLAQNEEAFSEIRARLSKIESDCSSIKQLNTDVSSLRTTTEQITNRIVNLETRIDDSEDRSRRNNLVFFGIVDAERETWAQSERLVIDVCQTNLGVTMQSRDIERAHRLGRFRQNKNRPIIVRLNNFKDKEQILSCAKKLKDSGISISEDYSHSTRIARKSLVAFAKDKSTPYKLRHNKLIIDNCVYVFDHATQKVIPQTS
uniref:Putative tick transposon n=1 Tax=Rhipicephalus pulchellus TaxID=72859 RepID=L7LWR8_RHIPC